MAKQANDPRIKVRVLEVSARSIFGRPSEMDKTIEKYETLLIDEDMDTCG